MLSLFLSINDIRKYKWKKISYQFCMYMKVILSHPLQTSLWNNLHPHQVIGTAAIVKEIDCLTATVEDISKVRSKFSSSILIESTRLCGFGGWFDVHFRVSLRMMCL